MSEGNSYSSLMLKELANLGWQEFGILELNKISIQSSLLTLGKVMIVDLKQVRLILAQFREGKSEEGDEIVEGQLK